jgi:glutathione peroxidase-family protein
MLEFPSPNDQSQESGEPEDVSVNCTVNGAVPIVGVPEKSVNGKTGGTAVEVTLI